MENTKYCWHCGKQIESEMNFCPHCGASQQVQSQEQSENKNHSLVTTTLSAIIGGIKNAIIWILMVPVRLIQYIWKGIRYGAKGITGFFKRRWKFLVLIFSMLCIAYAILYVVVVFFPRKESSSIEVEKIDSSQVVKDSRICIKMQKKGGVYQIPCAVNGVKMDFVFDTGASNVCISLIEAMFLSKNGYLEDDDYVGLNKTKIADGSIVEDMVINLRTIEIAGVVLKDVKATVASSIDAPLLLGQTALEKLGKIEIGGDTLFIIKEGKGTYKTIKTAATEIASMPPAPKEHWYDCLIFCDERRSEEHMTYAWIAYKNDMPELALEHCDKAIRFKGSAKAYLLKGYFLYDIYDDHSCCDEFEEYYKRNKGKKDFGYKTGDTLYYDNQLYNMAWSYHDWDNNRSLELGQELYMRNPHNIYAMDVISMAYYYKRKYDSANKWAKKMLESHLDDLKAYFRLAWLAEERGYKGEAKKYYEKCLEINPDEEVTLNNLAYVYWEEWEKLYEDYKGLNLTFDSNRKLYEDACQKRDYAISLWQKSARLGNSYAQSSLKSKGYEW